MYVICALVPSHLMQNEQKFFFLILLHQEVNTIQPSCLNFFTVDCLVSVWSQWSECQRNVQTWGYKWGNQTRIRSILQEPSPNGYPCPSTVDNQRCLLKQRYCELENTAAFFCKLSLLSCISYGWYCPVVAFRTTQ